MSNRLADARQRLVDALLPVLPGRVEPYPPAARWAAPRVWIEQPEITRATLGTRTTVAVATFPIWIAYDGANRAQVVGLDDLVSKCWDAVMHAGADPQLARREQIDISPQSALRACVLFADVTLSAVTLCLPPVEMSTIPSAVTQEATHG
jgi:hypothetical protein